MKDNKEKIYPNIAQSVGITAIVIISTLIFSPIMFIKDYIGIELTSLVYYLCVMGVPLAVILVIRRKKNSHNSFNLKIKNNRIIPILILAAFGLILGIASPLSTLIPMSDGMKEGVMELLKQNGLFTFITLVIAAPILEELVFRGIILDGLLRRYSPVSSILVSSFLFGIAHFNPWQLIVGMVMGLFMGWVYFKTKSLLATIIIHASANLLAFSIRSLIDIDTLINKTGTEIYGGLINYILIIIGSILVILSCLFFLNKEYKKSIYIREE